MQSTSGSVFTAYHPTQRSVAASARAGAGGGSGRGQVISSEK